MSGQLKTYHDAKPRKYQHTSPCSDCPFARKSLRGWLGSLNVASWMQIILGDGQIDCHTTTNQQCAGGAIFRANLCKVPRSDTPLQLPPNSHTVFSSIQEFVDHHTKRRQT
jgi:hypothetical protein